MKTTLKAAIGAAAICSSFALPAVAHEKGDWIVRAGAVTVDPNESSSLVNVGGADLAGSAVGVDSNTQLGLNIAYMLTDNVGVELLAATPFSHNLTLNTGALGLGKVDLGDTKHLPPTLSVQYYFGNAKSTLRPYVGLGVNYTTFFEESLSSTAKGALAASNLDIDDSIGLAAQAGIDFMLTDNLLINAAVWNIDIETEATLNTALGKAKVDVDIDPWVYMVSVGYKF